LIHTYVCPEERRNEIFPDILDSSIDQVVGRERRNP